MILSQFSKFYDANESPVNVLNYSKLAFGGLYIDDTKKCLLKNLILTVTISIKDKIVVN